MQLILDCGSGNTCCNDRSIIREMINKVVKIDNQKHEIIFKWQLFTFAGVNIPLTWKNFDYAYLYAREMGYKTTASVFDSENFDFLMTYIIPFVKIACIPDLYHLAYHSDVPVYVSVPDDDIQPKCDVRLACVRQYPATLEQYSVFKSHKYVSDHTVGWDLYKKYKPDILEKHYVHKRVEGNPDAGLFAVTPDQLEEVMEC